MNYGICPYCHKSIKSYPAISRKDNKTEICSICGLKEAMDSFLNANRKPIEHVYDTGGREKYFGKSEVSDCVCRAISIATGMDYKEVYNLINTYSKKERISKRKKDKSSARDGVYRSTVYRLLTDLGWKWHPTMEIGKGCKVHLNKKELPKGTLIVSVSKHLTCVKDGVLYDTYDCSRNGTRCVYGYYVKE